MKSTLAVALLILLKALPVSADVYGFREGSYSLGLESSYFVTKTNYDPNGNQIALPSGNQVTEMRFRILGSYDFDKNLSGYVTGTFNREDAQTTNLERVNTGFSEASLGGMYALYSGFVRVTPEVNVVVPLVAEPDLSTQNSILGDGVYVISGKFNVTKMLRQVGFRGYVGYSYRTGGLSSYLPFGVFGDGKWKSFFASLGMVGQSSIGSDQYGSNLFYRQSVTNLVDGGSLLYYSVNPTFLRLVGSAGINFGDHYAASVGVEQSLGGTNSAQGTRFLVTLTYNSDVNSTPEDTHFQSSPRAPVPRTIVRPRRTNAPAAKRSAPRGAAPTAPSTPAEEVAPGGEGDKERFNIDTSNEDNVLPPE